MGALLIPVIALVVVVVAVAVGAGAWSSRRHASAERVASPAHPTLDYRVPPGQDPAVLLAALAQEGFTASVDPRDTHLVRVSSPAGPDRDRAHVRSVIASVRTTGIDSGAPHDPGAVRFTDEE